ncbi:hypothetical protein BH10ACT10_BH10ACT10_24830 [soil metagenome]
MHRTATRSLAALAALTAVSGVAAAASPAALAHDDDRVRRGSCTGSTDWKVKVGPEDGRLEVQGEVDSNRAGQTWRWRLVHDGSVSDRGTRTTGGRSGSFEVRRVMVNLRGTDTFVFRAVNIRSGEVCRGTVNY